MSEREKTNSVDSSKPFPVDNPSPLYGKTTTTNKNKNFSFVQKKNLPSLPCTEGKKTFSGQSVSLVPKEETFSVDSPSQKKRKKKKKEKTKQNKTSNWTFVRKKNFPRTEEEIRLSGQFKPFAVDSLYTDCIYSSYTEEKRTLLRGQLKPVPCGQPVSLIVVRGKNFLKKQPQWIVETRSQRTVRLPCPMSILPSVCYLSLSPPRSRLARLLAAQGEIACLCLEASVSI